MKVLMYGWEFPPNISGGLGIACYGIVNELVKKNIQVTFVLPKSAENCEYLNNLSVIGCDQVERQIDKSFLEKFVDLKRIDALLHPYLNETSYLELLSSQKTDAFFSSLSSAQLSGHYGPDLFSEVFRYSIIAGSVALKVPHDVIHAHDWLTVLAGIEAKKISKKPLIFQIHALEFDRSGEHVNQRIYDIERYGLEQADKVVAVSQYTKNIIMKHYAIPDKKIEVVHNGIYAPTKSTEQRQEKSPYKTVLFLGRITRQKGPGVFIDIAHKILTKRKDVHFVVAGTGDMLKGMVEKTASYHIGSHVHFTGFLDQATVKKLYPLADVYVMPSLSEPFGLTSLEALSHGVPIIISKQSGASEVLNHVLKADFWDVDEMASKILALLDYQALRKEMLSNSRGEVKAITWENTANKLITVYEKLKGK